MNPSVDGAAGFYVYSFLRNRDSGAVQQAQLTGIDDASVTVISHNELAAAVSPIQVKKIRPQRKNLAAHQEIVTTLAKKWSMLPVSFGLIADDGQQITRILGSNHDILCEQLDRVADHVEMAVTLRWTVPGVIPYFVSRYPELSAARDLIAAGQASREDQIEMGRQLDQRLTGEREKYTQQFVDALSAVCKEIDVQAVREEAEVMRLACLIRREDEAQFNQAVHRAAELFSDDFAINFSGPWPPYSFVKMTLTMD
ncbi:MAG: GvpL/GvpF family gas vesicle protein [Pirellulaceae bacterium]|nr:GvpL/GvpF family gas vesicle protein [Pirellulaceae bacterium]